MMPSGSVWVAWPSFAVTWTERSIQKLRAANSVKIVSGSHSEPRAIMPPSYRLCAPESVHGASFQIRGQCRIEGALDAHQELAGLAHCTAPGLARGDVVAVRLHQFGRRGHGDREACATHHRQIDHVIPHVGGGLAVDVQLAAERLVYGELVVRALMDDFDAEVFCAVFHYARTAPGDDGKFDAAALEQLQSVAVERIEALVFLPVVSQEQGAVGHHAIDVEGDQPDFFCAGDQFGGHHTTPDFRRSCMLSAPTRVLSSSTTSRPLIFRVSIFSTAATASSSARIVLGFWVMTSAIFA